MIKAKYIGVLKPFLLKLFKFLPSNTTPNYSIKILDDRKSQYSVLNIQKVKVAILFTKRQVSISIKMMLAIAQRYSLEPVQTRSN
jgi:hypothetical protein